ncbi:MAG TPA: phytanoyl-CoA dioxygenase family protein [Micromonosporaceae bacterium]|nr:phytanoyl-CoA dioxygenase family protein [Micromonosporaceae bacterium]
MSTVDTLSHGVARDVTAQEVALFRRDGWVLLRGLVDPACTARLRGEAERLLGPAAEHHKQSTAPFSAIWRTYDEPSYASRPLWDFATSAPLGRLGSRFLRDRSVRFLRDELYLKMPEGGGEGQPTPWHQDFPYANRDRSEQVNFWIALNDIPSDGGALRYLSGSHRWGVLGRALADPGHDLAHQYPELLEECPLSPELALSPGDALVHHGLTVHNAPANRASTIRWAYTVVLFQADSRYTGVPWPRRLADRMAGIRPNEIFDHELTPVTWDPTQQGASVV